LLARVTGNTPTPRTIARMAKRGSNRAPRVARLDDGLVAPDDIDESFVPRVVPDVVELDVGDERVVIGGTWGQAQVLNPTAALVWQFLDGVTSLHDLIDDFSAATGTRRKVVKRDVLEFARSLGRNGLLVDVAEPQPEIDFEAFEPPKVLEEGDVLEPFALEDLDGRERSLAELRGRRVLLVNWSPSCGYCEMIAEPMAALEPELATADIDLVFVSSGDADTNRALVDRAGLQAPVLLRRDGIDPFRGLGTPAALLLDERGTVAQPLALGAFEVPALAADLTGVELPSDDGTATESAPDGVRYLPAGGGMCGPGAGAAGPSTEWEGTLALGFDDVHLGIRYNSGETSALLEKIFGGALIDDSGVPDNYSVALYSPDGASRELNLLVAGARQLVRSRSRARVLRALLSYVSGDLSERDPALLQVVATPAVRHGLGLLLPAGLLDAVKQLQPRFARHGIAVVDTPHALVDVETAELVVPEPSIEHDATVLEELDPGVRLGSTELPAVLPGRYPLEAWYLRRWDQTDPPARPGPRAERLAPALAVASVIGLCVTDDVAGTAASVAGLIERVPVLGVGFQAPAELVDAVSVAGEDVPAGSSRDTPAPAEST
jgi:thiol-disulfide isomerase/thioredoxin